MKIRRLSENEVEITGKVKKNSLSKELYFIMIGDDKNDFQIIADKAMLHGIKKESIICARGVLEGNKKIKASEINILNQAEKLPFDIDALPKSSADRQKYKSLEFRNSKVRSLLRLRSEAMKNIRSFFNENNFMEVTSPTIVGDFVEGPTDSFNIDNYFGKKAYLTITHMLHHQLLIAGGFEKIYEISPVFRAGYTDSIHNSEFYSIDYSMAYENCGHGMKLTEEFINRTISRMSENNKEDLVEISANLKNIDEFDKIKYDEFIELANKKGCKLAWGESHQIPKRAVTALGDDISYYYWITDFPENIKPFYFKEKGSSEKRAIYAELESSSVPNIGGVAEILTDYNALKSKISERGLNPKLFECYLESLKYGTPPMAQGAIGLDRLLMPMLNLSSISDIVPFPRNKKTLHP